MDTVTGLGMADAMSKAGCLGIHHRYCDNQTLHKAVMYGHPIAVSPSMGTLFIYNLKKSNENLVVMLDVAHGNSKKNVEFAAEMVKNGINVVSGNVIRRDAIERYLKVGVKYFRVGIGGGSACWTRRNLKVGLPQAYLLHQMYQEFGEDIVMISDGGHRDVGHIISALALGASFVMLGKLLAQTHEANNSGIYRGMASASALRDRGKTEFVVEGGEMNLKERYSLHDFLYGDGNGDTGVYGALQQVCYYHGARNLQELREGAEFVVMTPNATKEGMQ
jgi:IMP dehydrogenase